MNIELLRKKIQDTAAKMRALVEDYEKRDDGADFSEEDQKRFDDWATEVKADQELLTSLETRAKAIEDAEEAGRTASRAGSDAGFRTNTRGSAYDLDDLRFNVSAKELRTRAAEAVEKDEFLPDAMKEEATRKLQAVDRRGELATLMLFTGHPDYRSAFPKLVSGNGWALTDDERNAVMRAQSTAAASGGYAVPFTLDPTIVWTNDGAINPMRQIATIKTTTTEDWNGVTSAGATAHWRGEAEQVDDDSIDLTQPNIPVYKMDLFTPYSIEIEMDWPQLESELREAMIDAKERKEATAHLVGTGSDQPTGLITALVAGASTVPLITPATAETFAQADVFNLRRQLPRRYRPSREVPKWIANTGTYDAIRQFDTGGGGGFWTDMNDGTPDRLLSYQTFEASAMDDAQDINAAATDTNYILVVGDAKRFYIVDRVGMRVENIPHLFGTANNRPTGQRGIYSMLRTGADCIDDNAFRLLNVATTA